MKTNQDILTIAMGETRVTAKRTNRPKSDDPTDCTCAHCKGYGCCEPKLDVVQLGFDRQHIFTVLWCIRCGHSSFYDYEELYQW